MNTPEEEKSVAPLVEQRSVEAYSIEPELLQSTPRRVEFNSAAGSNPWFYQSLICLLLVFVGLILGYYNSSFPWRDNTTAYLMVIVPIVLVLLFVEQAIWHTCLLHKRLVQYGRTARGTIVSKQFQSEQNYRASPSDPAGYWLTYSYPTAPSGFPSDGSMNVSLRQGESVSEGEDITILWLPHTGL